MMHRRERILVVDDEPHVTTVLKLFLERVPGYQVRVENTSTKALAVAREFEPNLILLDVDMPNLSGGELASRFADDPTLKEVPIVFLTGSVTKKEVEATEGIIGGLRFMAKPIDRNEVLGCVIRYLKPKRRISTDLALEQLS